MNDVITFDVSYDTNKERQRIHPELIYVKDDDENYNQHSSGKLCKIGTSIRYSGCPRILKDLLKIHFDNENIIASLHNKSD